MNFIRFSFLLSFSLLFMLSCQTAKKANSSLESVTLSEIVVQASSAKGPYHEANTITNDLLHTKLDLSFDWQKQHVNGVATLSFKPYFYPQNYVILDAKGFDIHAVNLISGDNRTILKFDYDSKKLNIQLNKEYTRSDTFKIEIEYTAKPNELPEGGSEAIQSDKGLYFINADGKDSLKPRQIWTQGETEANSKWFPTIDSPNERTTQEMYITVDTAFTVLSNGELIYSLENGDGTKTDYWKMDLPHAPYLFMMAIGNFEVVEDSWGDMKVNYYVEPEFKKYAKGVFGNTPEMLTFFSNKLKYPYPWNKYSQVVVRDFVSGAMENTTASVFMEALQIDDREILDVNWDYIIAHELFHHWFGDLVTCESWSNLPLNESFANYSEYLWAEYKYGLDEADYHGQKEMSEYMNEAQTKREPLIRYHYLDKEDMFDRHSYNKGGRVLHMLRNYVGDDAFFSGLNNYLEKNKFSPVEIHNLRLAFEEVTGEDLNWFFNQWFLNPGHPELKVTSEFKNGSLVLTVEQLQDSTQYPVYKLPLKVSYWLNGQKKTEPILIEKKHHSFSFPCNTKPDGILLDSDHVLLGTLDHAKTKQELIFQYRNSERYLARFEALKSLISPDTQGVVIENPKLADAEIRKVLLEALNDKFWAIRDYVINQFFEYQLQNPEYFVKQIEKIALSDPKPEVRANAIYFLSRYYNAPYVEIYKKGLIEKPYSVVAASLASYLRSADSSIVLDLKEYETLPSLDITLTLANHYLAKGVKGKYRWFKNKMIRNKSNPRAVYNLLFFFGEYASGLGEIEKDGAKLILEDIKNTSHYDVIKALAEKYIQKLNSPAE